MEWAIVSTFDPCSLGSSASVPLMRGTPPFLVRIRSCPSLPVLRPVFRACELQPEYTDPLWACAPVTGPSGQPSHLAISSVCRESSILPVWDQIVLGELVTHATNLQRQ